MLQREAQDRVRAHRGAGERGTFDPERVEHGFEVTGELLVAVAGGIGRGTGLPVPTGVVGDDAIAGALEQPRAHDDVAARRGEPVQEHDRQ